MTQPDFAAIRARAEAATKGPWRWSEPPGVLMGPGPTERLEKLGVGSTVMQMTSNVYGQPDKADAEFIAHAREDIPALLAAIDDLTAKQAELVNYHNGKLQVALDRIDELTAKRDAVLALHAPMANTHPLQPACPDCLGGIHAEDPEAARECGCWGLSQPVCGQCAVRFDNGHWWYKPWPCETVRALTKAVTDGS